MGGQDAGVDRPPPPPPMGQLIAQGDKLRAVLFSPDGDRLLYTTGTSTVSYPTGILWAWSFSRGQATMIEDRARIDTVAFINGGNGLVYLKDLQGPGVVGDIGALTVYDFATAAKVTVSTQTAGTVIKLSPDHARITYVDGYDSVLLTPNHPLMVWTFAAGAATTLEATGGTVRAWSPDSRYVVYFIAANMYLWDTRDGSRTTIATTGGADLALAWSAASDKVAFQIPLYVGVYDVAAKTTVMGAGNVPTGDTPSFSPDGSRLAFRSTTSGNTTMVLMTTATGATTSLGAGTLGPFSPDGALLPTFVPVVGGGRPTLHFRTLATGADATIATNAQAPGVIWSDDGKQAAFITNSGSTSATSMLQLWTAASGTPRTLTAAATGAVQGSVSFAGGGTRLVYAAFAPPGGTPKATADLYLMDLASGTAVNLGTDLVGQTNPNSVAYLTADGKCAAFTAGYDSAHMLANVMSFPLTAGAALPAGGTVLDYAASYWPIVVSSKRVAYVIGGGLYASVLPCGS
jgi:Tol biopolymer transport system component